MPVPPQKWKRKKKQPKRINNFGKLHQAFKQLSEPVQYTLVIGILILLAWIVSHPDVLQGIIRAFQLWFTAKGLMRWLQS